MSLPGLAFFYGGLVRTKNMLSIIAQVFILFSLAIILWITYGYSFTFTGENPCLGSFDKIFLKNISTHSIVDPLAQGILIPEYIFVAFQGTFSAIALALTVGSYAERMKFSAVIIFGFLWFTLCYLPIAHMTWHNEGFLYKEGALDFAGGTVVHINAGIAGLIGAYQIGPRLGFNREAMPPHSLALTALGASLLWVGWFGFNGGSSMASNELAALSFLNTLIAPASAALAWIIGETFQKKQASVLGTLSGVISGLVSITPAAGFVGPVGSMVIGATAGFLCLFFMNKFKKFKKLDDSLDVFCIHGIGGIVGALLVAPLHSANLGGNAPSNFSILSQTLIQIKSILITVALSIIVSWLSFWVAKKLVGLRIKPEEEREGLDITEHGESAYHY